MDNTWHLLRSSMHAEEAPKGLAPGTVRRVVRFARPHWRRLAVFGLLTGGRRPRVALGLAYGAAVWLVSYEGWVPKLTVQPPAHRDAPGRAATMAAAHLVYGGVLAAVLRRMRRDVCPRGGRSAAQ